MMDSERLDRTHLEKYAHPYTIRSRSWDDIVFSYFVWGMLALVVATQLLTVMIDLRAPAQHWPDYGYPIFGAIAIGLIVVHEGLHGIVARAFGMRVTFGVKWYGAVAYTKSYGGRVARWQKAAITLTPIVVITTACFLAYRLTTSNAVMLLALIVLFGNTVGSAVDLRNAVALLRSPYGTVFEISDRESSLAIYEPRDHAVMASAERTTRAETLPDGELPRDPREPLSREFDHWVNDIITAARNRHLQSTVRTYGHHLQHRFGRWVFTQIPPSIRTHYQSTHE